MIDKNFNMYFKQPIFNLAKWTACVAVAYLAWASSIAHAVLPIQHWQTTAGTRVYFVATHTIPIIDIRIDLDAGGRFDPPLKTGLAETTINMLDAGIVANDKGIAKNEGEIADTFAELGAVYSVSADKDRSSVKLRILSASAQRQPAIDLLAAMLHQPAFPDDVLQRRLQIARTALQDALTQAAVIAEREFTAAIYGTHPYGQQVTEASLSKITQQDVAQFYRQRYGANRVAITLVGDITLQQAQQIAEKLSASLPSASSAETLPMVQMLQGEGKTIRLTNPSEQAHIFIGQPAIKRNDPDYFALLVGNYILGGGGFASRLMAEIREKRGLAYGVNSAFIGLLQPGIFRVNVQTRKDQTDEVLLLLRKTLSDFIKEGPTNKELIAAKNNLINGFPLYIDSNSKWLDNVANIAWYGLQLNYLDTWIDHIKKVDVEQIRLAFSKHLQPASMITVIVGP